MVCEEEALDGRAGERMPCRGDSEWTSAGGLKSAGGAGGALTDDFRR
jgi:hypothetical protein